VEDLERVDGGCVAAENVRGGRWGEGRCAHLKG
jgi:hypothetical protein